MRVGQIAAVVSTSRPATEALLAAVVARMRASGAVVVGVLAETPVEAGTCGAGILRSISSAQPFSIRLSEPSSRTSCLLNAAGVLAAGRDVLDQIADSDLVVLSKFGKLEATSSGLRAAFETAARLAKPIVTSVWDKHRAAWKAFAPCAADLPSDEAALLDWCRRATSGATTAEATTG
jgi:hypothetical protein